MEEFWDALLTGFYVAGSLCGIMSFIDLLIRERKKNQKFTFQEKEL